MECISDRQQVPNPVGLRVVLTRCAISPWRNGTSRKHQSKADRIRNLLPVRYAFHPESWTRSRPQFRSVTEAQSNNPLASVESPSCDEYSVARGTSWLG